MDNKSENSDAMSAWTPPLGFIERHINIKETASIAGLGVSTIYRIIPQGKFPKPIPTCGLRVTRFRLSDVLAWLEHREAA